MNCAETAAQQAQCDGRRGQQFPQSRVVPPVLVRTAHTRPFGVHTPGRSDQNTEAPRGKSNTYTLLVIPNPQATSVWPRTPHPRDTARRPLLPIPPLEAAASRTPATALNGLVLKLPQGRDLQRAETPVSRVGTTGGAGGAGNKGPPNQASYALLVEMPVGAEEFEAFGKRTGYTTTCGWEARPGRHRRRPSVVGRAERPYAWAEAAVGVMGGKPRAR